KLYNGKYHTLCLDAFASNIPIFFSQHELDEYATFLSKNAADNYWCIFDNEQFIGAGGFWVSENGSARLCYGIIHALHHKKGFGRALVEYRLRKLASNDSVKCIGLDTSQHNPGFFKRFGFGEIEVKPDAYAPGLHAHEMELVLSPTNRKHILDAT
ncbi:MAG: N-acetyltransferase, partial [Burkholderiaceae bacterium]|nr:N-acetyltransferase [Burkholderiaceae bacterium]